MSQSHVTSDLWALVATIGLAVVQLAASSILTLRELGGQWVAGPRDETAEVHGVGGRIVRAHRNLLEIFPQFAAALFVVHAATATGHLVNLGAWLFFLARCLYVPAYAIGPIGLRPVCWVIAQIGIAIILSALIF